MIHVDKENAVEGMLWQHRISRHAKAYRDIVQSLPLDALRKTISSLPDDVLRQDPAAPSNDWGQAHGIITLAGADIGHRHAGGNFGQPHYLLSLARPVARILCREAIIDDRRNGPASLWKLIGLGLCPACGRQQNQ
jgi:hypothetical protein